MIQAFVVTAKHGQEICSDEAFAVHGLDNYNCRDEPKELKTVTTAGPAHAKGKNAGQPVLYQGSVA